MSWVMPPADTRSQDGVRKYPALGWRRNGSVSGVNVRFRLIDGLGNSPSSEDHEEPKGICEHKRQALGHHRGFLLRHPGAISPPFDLTAHHVMNQFRDRHNPQTVVRLCSQSRLVRMRNSGSSAALNDCRSRMLEFHSAVMPLPLSLLDTGNLRGPQLFVVALSYRVLTNESC